MKPEAPKPVRYADRDVVARAAKRQAGRQRVCLACVRGDDIALGRVHSDLPCHRCKKTPCFGIITVGAIPLGD
jgi:hypothetical protein